MKEVSAGCVCGKVFMDETLKISGENVQNKRMRGKKKRMRGDRNQNRTLRPLQRKKELMDK